MDNARAPIVENLFDTVPRRADAELFTQLLARPGLRIERIVSTGQTTSTDSPHDQPHDEWVLLLAGAARLRIGDAKDLDLRPGDCLLIPAHCEHRVTWTDPHQPTIWLAVHIG